MTPDQMHPCATCGALYTSPLAADLCCTDDNFDRGYD